MTSTQQACMHSGSDISTRSQVTQHQRELQTLGMLQGRGQTSDLAEGLIDLLSQRLLLNLDDQVHHGHIGGGHTEGNACNPNSTSWY